MNSATYWWKLRRLQRKKEKILASYKRDKEKAERDKKAREQIENIDHDAMFESDLMDDEINSLASRHLIQSAQRLLLPIPEYSPDSDAWKQSRLTGRIRLTRSAMATLRSGIRVERKERRESAMLWIAALTGALGALTGLLAVWKS